MAEKLADEVLDAVYSSDLLRARETAGTVAAARGLDVIPIRDLRERHFGTWEGLTDDEIFARFPEAQGGSWGDAESQEEMAKRVVRALQRIGEGHDGGRVLVVSHGGPLRAVLAQCGVDGVEAIANCHVLRIEIEGGVIRAE